MYKVGDYIKWQSKHSDNYTIEVITDVNPTNISTTIIEGNMEHFPVDTDQTYTARTIDREFILLEGYKISKQIKEWVDEEV